MKRVIFCALTSTLMAHASVHPYKIFAQTFSSSDNPRIDENYANLQYKLRDVSEVKVVKRDSGRYYVLVIEGIMEPSKANQVLARIQSIPEHADAFMLPAPELLDKEEVVERQEPKISQNIQEKEDISEPEQVEIVEIEMDMFKPKLQDSNTPDLATENTISSAITLNSVVKTVLETNPNMQETIYNYMQAGKDLDIANRAYFPILNLNSSYGYYAAKKHPLQDKFEDGTRGEATLALVQNLYNGGADSNMIKQQKSRVESNAFLVAEKADRLTLDTVGSFLDVIKEKMLLELARENVVVHKKIYGQIKDRVSSGFGKTSEERQAGSRLSLAQSNLVAQENNILDALSSFEKIYGQPAKGLELVLPNFNTNLPQTETEAINKAMLCNPSIKNREENIRFSRFIKEAANAAFLPIIDFETSAKISKSHGDDKDNTREESYNALIKLKYNIFNKGIDSLEKEKRQISLQREQTLMDITRNDLTESLKFSWQSYTLNQKKLSYIFEHVAYSKDTLEGYYDEFKIGKRDLINLLDAENEYYNAQKEQITTNIDLLLSKYRILDNMGLLVDSFESGFAQKYTKSACSIESNLY